MENADHNNTLIQEGDQQDIKFEYNFITLPWDDRTTKSKCGVILLLLSIFLVTIVCVINSFYMQFRGFKGFPDNLSQQGNKHEINCQLVRVEDYNYVARIHSIGNNELICLGAVLSSKVIATNGACVKTQIRVYVGGASNQACRKGFTAKSSERISHEGVMSKILILLTFRENLLKCAKAIPLNTKVIKPGRGFVIGRAVVGTGGRISKHPIQIIGTGKNCSCPGLHAKRVNNVVCVRSMSRCPVLVSDLLVQSGVLLGLSSTSVGRQDNFADACFADLSFVLKEIQEIMNL